MSWYRAQGITIKMIFDRFRKSRQQAISPQEEDIVDKSAKSKAKDSLKPSSNENADSI